MPFATPLLLSTMIGAMAVAAPHVSASPLLIGVNVHNGPESESRAYKPDFEIPALRALGVNSFRDGLWPAQFSPDATYPFGPGYDRLKQVLDAGIGRPLLILMAADGPSLAAPDQRAKALADAARFAAAVAHSGRPWSPLYEVWNEWNVKALGIPGTPPDPSYSAENYVALARAIAPAVHQADPNAKVLVGAIGDDPQWTWTRRALDAGLLQSGDGVSLHLFDYCDAPADRTAARLIERSLAFRQLIRRANNGKDADVYVTEFGWPTAQGACHVDIGEATANTVQYIRWARTQPWIKGIWLYELKNSGYGADNIEDNFGVYDFDGKPKLDVSQIRDAIKQARGQ